MTDKKKVINELKEALDSLDITNEYRLNLIRAIEYLQEDPVSDDLEKAACNYGDELDNVLVVGIDDDNTVGEYAIQAFKAGANWQKEQMIKKAVNH